jgi:hypothetical protein
MRVHAPHSVEGAQVWDLVLRCGGQLRAVPGAVIGYDMTAVLAMGDALEVPRVAVAEFMPQIESVAVAAMNAAAETEPGDRTE